MKRLILSLFWLSSAELIPAATVSLSSSAGTVISGQQITVQVNVAGVADLYAWQLDINFDPVHLTAVSIAEELFLATGGATSFFAGTIDNASGTITFNANSLFGAVPGVTGSGTIMSILFTAGAPTGSSALTLANVTLLDSSFNEIAGSLSGLSLEVTSSTAIPEPRTLALAAGAFALVALSKRRTRLPGGRHD